MDNLKNCPFCGAEAVMDTFTTAMEKKPRFRVRCTNCPCDLGWDHWSEEEARDAWNKRTEDKENGRTGKSAERAGKLHGTSKMQGLRVEGMRV